MSWTYSVHISQFIQLNSHSLSLSLSGFFRSVCMQQSIHYKHKIYILPSDVLLLIKKQRQQRNEIESEWEKEEIEILLSNVDKIEYWEWNGASVSCLVWVCEANRRFCRKCKFYTQYREKNPRLRLLPSSLSLYLFSIYLQISRIYLFRYVRLTRNLKPI